MSQITPFRWFAVILVAMAFVACDARLNAEPTPTPTPYDVTQIYRYLNDLKESNIAELREMEHNWRPTFRGTVHRIEERKMRFYIEPPRVLAEDRYVECNFPSNRYLVSMRAGDYVTVEGMLVRALRGRLWGIGEHGAVVFEGCTVVDIHGSRRSNLGAIPGLAPAATGLEGITAGLGRRSEEDGFAVDRNFNELLGAMEEADDLSRGDIALVHRRLPRRRCGQAVRVTTLERAIEGLTGGSPIALGESEDAVRDRLQQ